MKKLILLATSLLLSNLLVAEIYKISVEDSSIGFENRKAVITVEGKFHQFVGEADFNPETKTLNYVTATIQTESIDTQNKERDEHLRNEDFFETATFPTIIFTSYKIEQTIADEYTAEGQLTIKGITKPVVLTGKLIKIDTLNGQPSAMFSATGTVNRREFGVAYDGFFEWILFDEVTLVLDVQLVKQ